MCFLSKNSSVLRFYFRHLCFYMSARQAVAAMNAERAAGEHQTGVKVGRGRGGQADRWAGEALLSSLVNFDARPGRAF